MLVIVKQTQFGPEYPPHLTVAPAPSYVACSGAPRQGQSRSPQPRRFTGHPRVRPWGARLGLLIGFALFIVGVPWATVAQEEKSDKTEAFKELLSSLQKAEGGDMTAEQARKLLETAKEVGEPYAASLVVRDYLKTTLKPDPQVLRLAGENAILAGDAKAAIARYKAFLRVRGPGPESSDVAADICFLLVDFLGYEEDAFRVQAKNGSRVRHTTRAKKYDRWVLDMALRKKDLAAMGERFALILADKTPVEQERTHYWGYLDALIHELRLGSPATYATLPSLKKIVPLVRDPERKVRSDFYRLHLQYLATSAGKENRVLEKNFEAVARAANAYFDSSSSLPTLRDIIYVFTANHQASKWQDQRHQKQAFLKAAFAKLSPGDQAWLCGWKHGRWLWEDEQWAALATEFPAFLPYCDDAVTRRFLPHLTAHEQFKKQAGALQESTSRYAAVVTSVAAAQEFDARVKALMQTHGWHLPFDELYWIISEDLWPIHKRLAGVTVADEQAAFSKAVADYANTYFIGSPIALMAPRAAGQVVVECFRHWRESGTAAASLGKLFEKLSWIPYSDSDRDHIIEPLAEELAAWQKALIKSGASGSEAATVAEVKDLLGRALPSAPAFDPAKAPSELARELAFTVVAVREKDQEKFVEHARKVHALIGDLDAAKPLFGGAALTSIATNYLEAFDTFDFQCDLLESCLATFEPGKPNRAVHIVFDRVVDERWPSCWQVPRGDEAKAKQLSALLGAAVSRLADQDKFSSILFSWFRGTRNGRGWRDYGTGLDVMAKLVERKTLLRHDCRPRDAKRSVTWNYMRLLVHEFPSLHRGEYRASTYFDDMFIEEARASNRVDWRYWDFGHDKEFKIRTYVAELLQASQTVQFGAPFDSAEDFWRWSDRCIREGPQQGKLLAYLEQTYGKTRFDEDALGAGYFKANLELTDGATRKDFFTNLAQFVSRAAEHPFRFSLPSMAPLSSLSNPADMTDAELDTLCSVFTPELTMKGGRRDWRKRAFYEPLISVTHEALLAKDRQPDLYRAIPYLWAIARDMNQAEVFRLLGRNTAALFEDNQFSLAAVYSITGLNMVGPLLPEDVRTQLMATRSKAISNIGGVIPVPKTDPRYPIYAAQTAFFSGNLEAAWMLYLESPPTFIAMFKDLDPGFSIWVIDKNTEAMDFQSADSIARQMMRWFDTVAAGFDPEIRGRLLCAYADIAFARKEYPRARAQYERVIAGDEFEGTRAQGDAELRVAEIDRLTKDFDEAIEKLEKLTQRRDRHLQTEAFYQLALVKYDQEEFLEAGEYLDRVFMRNPEHPDGRILQGSVYLKRKKLLEATEIDLGIATAQRVLVPGTPLKVKLEDRNLAVMRRASATEVRVWTDSDDEEKFFLFPFGDSKTRFEGSLLTELAPATKGDGTLQVLGGDRVHYDFSEAFKDASGIEGTIPMVLNVVTDGELVASSGKLMTKEEREEALLEKVLRARLEARARARGRGSDEDAPGDDIALSTVRAEDQVKPGNSISVRVVDPDRSTTTEKDVVTITVATSGGDGLRAFSLAETDTHSGIFEGTVPTAPAPASAFASDTEEGRSPNSAVSSKQLPPWRGVPDGKRPKILGVDLKDNVALGKLIVDAKEPGHAIKGFMLQTSLNGRDFFTRAMWPMKMPVWNGAFTLEVVRAPKGLSGGFANLAEIGGAGGEHGYKVYDSPKSAEIPLGPVVNRNASLLKLEPDSWFVARLRGAFYQPERAVRTVRLEPSQAGRTSVQYTFSLDQRVSDNLKTPHVIRRILPKGVHILEVLVYADRRAKPELKLLWDSPGVAELVPIPVEEFDPKKHPEIREAVYRPPATVLVDDEKTKFTTEFQPDTRARMVRLVMTDFEGDAPAVNRIHLTDTEWKVVLPLDHDFTQMEENDTLEVVAGDRISITYNDPTFISPEQEFQEAFLDVTFHDAELHACFVEYEEGRQGKEAVYIPMHRFLAGEPVTLFIQDPDLDVSGEMDTISINVKPTVSHTEPIVVKALETENHTGIFLAKVFPVTGEPERDTEIKVTADDDLEVAYLDRHNTSHGIPWERKIVVEQSSFIQPELRVFDVSVAEIAEDEPGGRPAGRRFERRSASDAEIPPTHDLIMTRPAQPDYTQPAGVLLDAPITVEVMAPTISLAPTSEAVLYIQTSAGRELQGVDEEDPFDITAPGTVTLSATPGEVNLAGNIPAGCRAIVVKNAASDLDAVSEGRFTFVVQTQLGGPMDRPKLGDDVFGRAQRQDARGGRRGGISLTEEEQEEEELSRILMVKGNDTIYAGFMYTDSKGQEQWLTQVIKPTSSVMLDAMDRRYEEIVDGVHVGQTVYFRVMDCSKDTTAERDEITIAVSTTSGQNRDLRLVESFEHTGEFRGFLKPVFIEEEGVSQPAVQGTGAEAKADGAVPTPAGGTEEEEAAPAADEQAQDVALEDEPASDQQDPTLPAAYGDVIKATYRQTPESDPLECEVEIYKGSDGRVVPFTKQYEDPRIGFQTQFAIAEAYFELAKKHRALGQDALARREIAQGRRLLEEAIPEFSDTEARAQADYLLATLSLEFADDAKDPSYKDRYHMDAVSRFTDIVAAYPDSPYAPKAQFKKALVYEKMGQFEKACEEYVKLSYKYPDNELVAETMARLGQYFWRKGKEVEAEAEEEEDLVEREKKKLEAGQTLTIAADVFGRMSDRFPEHDLSEKTLVLSAQAYALADKYEKAAEVFEKAIETIEKDKDLAAEAMYWYGDCHMRMGRGGRGGANSYVNAYRMLKRLTWDYPESKWAKFARGRLTDPSLERLDQN